MEITVDQFNELVRKAKAWDALYEVRSLYLDYLELRKETRQEADKIRETGAKAHDDAAWSAKFEARIKAMDRYREAIFKRREVLVDIGNQIKKDRRKKK